MKAWFKPGEIVLEQIMLITSVYHRIFSGKVRRLLRYVIPVLFGLVIIVNTLGIARTYVCPNHSGSILKMAVDVSEGAVLYRDTYSQYGPLPTWIQAVAVTLFGKNLIVVYLATAMAYGITVWILYFLWLRILPWWGAGVSVCLLVATLPYVGLPWSNYFLTVFSALAAYLMMRYLETGKRWLAFATGISLGCATLCRQQGFLAFVALLFFAGSLLVVMKLKLKRVVSLAVMMGTGWFVTVGCFFVWLVLVGAVQDWYLQTIKIVNVAYRQYNDAGIVSKIANTLSGMFNNNLFYVSGSSNSLYDGTPTGWAFVGAAILLYLALPWVRRLSGRVSEDSEIVAYLLACVSFAG